MAVVAMGKEEGMGREAEGRPRRPARDLPSRQTAVDPSRPRQQHRIQMVGMEGTTVEETKEEGTTVEIRAVTRLPQAHPYQVCPQ
jgi:hypothetical protein